MPLNEADTRALLIEPMLNRAGWTRSRVTREYYYCPDWQYTPGRIVLRGGRAQREKPRVMDYLLRYTDGFPIAVVEAKAEDVPASAGLEQAIRYARENNLMFAYATNGHEILEWDGFTNTTREITEFPSPDELWERWKLNTGLSEVPRTGELRVAELRPRYSAELAAARRRNPLLHPYAPPELTRGKTPHYFQEAAIREAIVRIMRGQKRILLTMATGTGKTFVAMQIVWKLFKSGWIHQQKGRPGRMLFLADRLVLRDQAYNTFSPFVGGHGDPRFLIESGQQLSFHHDLYFGIYQTLWSEDERGQRLFERFPRDFFDIVIIDEAHRSGFGTWKEILDHFETAIHLGMTATPRQDENIDTYAYFCAEEPPIPVDPQDPSKGFVRRAAYTYSLGQGIEDGFLATYKVHRVYTNIDREGLHISRVLEQGAEIIVPEGAELREDYYTPQFEREIRLPDRTRTLVRHLAHLLRQFGPMQKTMVFCVDIEHAREVARLLNNEFADLGLEDFAVPIVSEEGEQSRRWLQYFQDSDRKTPVVATTAELLSTGVDVPSCRNIVFMKTISSPILFKQIIGRGSRIDPATGKLWFRIIDYTGATRLLDPRWDRPFSLPVQFRPLQEQTAVIEGKVTCAETGDVIQGASVAVMAGPNDQRGPVLTDEEGRYRFESLPVGEVTVIAFAPHFGRRRKTAITQPNQTTQVDIELPLAQANAGSKTITVKNLEVTIAEEATFLVKGLEEPLTLEQYVDYSREWVLKLAPNWESLMRLWQDEQERQRVRTQLEEASVHPEVLAEVLNIPDADPVDVLAYLAFRRTPILTRAQRAALLLDQQSEWLNTFPPHQRAVLEALLEKYRLGGIEQITDPRVFRLPPFKAMGELRGVVQRFGGTEPLRQALAELQRRLYEAA